MTGSSAIAPAKLDERPASAGTSAPPVEFEGEHEGIEYGKGAALTSARKKDFRSLIDDLVFPLSELEVRQRAICVLYKVYVFQPLSVCSHVGLVKAVSENLLFFLLVGPTPIYFLAIFQFYNA